MLETVFAARSLKPPSDSKTSGTKDTPTAWHGEACIAIFLFSPTAKAWPDVRAAPWRVSGCKVEMTVTSSAAFRISLAGPHTFREREGIASIPWTAPECWRDRKSVN